MQTVYCEISQYAVRHNAHFWPSAHCFCVILMMIGYWVETRSRLTVIIKVVLRLALNCVE